MKKVRLYLNIGVFVAYFVSIVYMHLTGYQFTGNQAIFTSLLLTLFIRAVDKS